MDIFFHHQLGHAGRDHQHEEILEHGGVVAHGFVAFLTKTQKLLEIIALLHTHHVCHFRGEHKRSTFALDSEFALKVTEEVSEVDVEQMPSLGYHDVAVVAVTDTEDVRRDQVARATAVEVLLRI